MIDWRYVASAICILLIVSIIKVFDQMRIARNVDVRSQQRPNVSPANVPSVSGLLSFRLIKRKKSMEEPKIVKFRKIPLRMLIDTLVGLYNGGANYIDITGVADDVQDMITVSVEDEYMEEDKSPPEDEVIAKNKKLSDDDLNELIK